jgi:hypothetical protein
MRLKWKLVSVRLETVLVCMNHTQHTMARKSFWMHPMVLLGDEAQVESHFGPCGRNVNVGV